MISCCVAIGTHLHSDINPDIHQHGLSIIHARVRSVENSPPAVGILVFEEIPTPRDNLIPLLVSAQYPSFPLVANLHGHKITFRNHASWPALCMTLRLPNGGRNTARHLVIAGCSASEANSAYAVNPDSHLQERLAAERSFPVSLAKAPGRAQVLVLGAGTSLRCLPRQERWHHG